MDTPPPHAPSPHAFCRATGFLYQSIGLVLALGACCWWSFSGLIQEPMRTPAGAAAAPPEGYALATSGQIWAMLSVCVLLLGGLGLVALGLGLQAERRGSARAAMWVSAAIALFFWIQAGHAVLREPATVRILLAAGMGLLWTVAFLFAGVCVDELRRFPATPADSSWTRRDEDDLRRASSPRSPDRTSR